jgi:hypothetical protein
MPFNAYYLDADGNLQACLGEEEVRHAFESKQGLLWARKWITLRAKRPRPRPFAADRDKLLGYIDHVPKWPRI